MYGSTRDGGRLSERPLYNTGVKCPLSVRARWPVKTGEKRTREREMNGAHIGIVRIDTDAV